MRVLRVLLAAAVLLVAAAHAVPLAHQPDALFPLHVRHQQHLEFLKVPSPGSRRAVLTEEDFVEKLDKFIKSEFTAGKSIAMTVSVVYQNKTVFSKGYGQTKKDGGRPVDETTYFGIGSTTKAFTTALLSQLAYKYRVDGHPFETDLWTTLLHRHFNVSLSDEQAAARVTLADLCAHKVGVPRNDELWDMGILPLTEGPEFVTKLVQFLEPNFDFRTNFEYNNLMFAVAGHIAELLTGTPWKDLIQTRLLTPLGMNSTLLSVPASPDNYAHPYVQPPGSTDSVALPWDINRVIDIVAPAGSISSNAVDMAQWMKYHLCGCAPEGADASSPIFSIPPEFLQFTHKPQFSLKAPLDTFNYDYSLGWVTAAYKDKHVVWHNGGTLGHTSLVWLMPFDALGVFLSATTDDAYLVSLAESRIAAYAADLLVFGQAHPPAPPVPVPVVMKQRGAVAVDPAPAVDLDADIPNLAGTYAHPAYGRLVVAPVPGTHPHTFAFKIGQLTGTLTLSHQRDHQLFYKPSVAPQSWQSAILGNGWDDMFAVARSEDGWLVYTIRMPFEPLASPTFTRQPETALL